MSLESALPSSLLAHVASHAQQRPEDRALQVRVGHAAGFAVGWASLHRMATGLARNLLTLAPRRGVLLVEDAPAVLVPLLMLACDRSGHTLALGNPRWSPAQRDAWRERIAPVLQLSSQAPARLRTASTIDALEAALRELRWDSVKWTSPTDLPDNAHLILSTSGSTGTPKAVVLTRRAVMANATQFVRMLRLGAAHVNLAAAPLWHAAGLHVLTLPMLVAGGTTILHESFDPVAVLQDLVGTTHTVLVPTHWTLLVDHGLDPSHTASLQAAISGGAPMTVSLQDALLRAKVPLAQGYGLTEATAMVTLRLPGDAALDPADVGTPGPATELRVDAPPGSEGPILVRGPQRMAGYMGSPWLAADAWIDTGDVGILTSEGRLLWRGRRDYRIRTGGESVYPERVEAVLSAAPGVAGIVAYPLADPLWGERVAVLVRPLPGSVVTLDALQRFARGRLADFEVPRALRAVHHLPMLSNGKPDRQQILDDLKPWQPRRDGERAAS